MKIIETGFRGLVEIEPTVYEDKRGYFFESYNQELFKRHGITATFIQDNQSKSQRGVVRGLHFQAPPHTQGKLVRVINGSVLDVVVDIRVGSPTYGKHHSVLLTEENKKMFWVPAGFAHGFATLEDNTVFSYKCTDLYDKPSEGCVLWNDEELGIEWGIEDPIVSQKDQEGTPWKDFSSPFIF